MLKDRRDISINHEVALVAEVGSTVHGISVAEQDDLDVTIVRFEGWQEFVTGPAKRQSMMVRTQPEGARSGPGDIDLNVYTVRKFVSLAAVGNPSILGCLYSPDPWVGDFDWVDWARLTELVRSKRAGRAYQGYMRHQLERWIGVRGQRNVNRPELIEAYGFDTKYAGHVIRLGFQGIEYLTTGALTLPMQPNEAALVRAVRLGKYSESDTISVARALEVRLFAVLADSSFPDRPDKGAVDGWVADTYQRYYGGMA